MQRIVRIETSALAASAGPGHIATWNRQLLSMAAVFALWAATMLALHTPGPDVRAIIVAESMPPNPPDR